MDTTVTGSLAGVLRAADTGPKVRVVSPDEAVMACVGSKRVVLCSRPSGQETTTSSVSMRWVTD